MTSPDKGQTALSYYSLARSVAHHVRLPPSSVLHLLAQQERASPPNAVRVCMRLPRQRQRLERKICRVREADAPRAEPRAIGSLGGVDILDRARDGTGNLLGAVGWMEAGEDFEGGEDRGGALRIVVLWGAAAREGGQSCLSPTRSKKTHRS